MVVKGSCYTCNNHKEIPLATMKTGENHNNF